jgi:hypothetical protein
MLSLLTLDEGTQFKALSIQLQSSWLGVGGSPDAASQLESTVGQGCGAVLVGL